jgi:folate-dependent phosphoribosylglycinamide formyltransferase PurN
MGSGIKAVVMCCEGLYQRYLVNRVAAGFDLAGVIIVNDPGARGSLLGRLSRYVNPVEAFHYLESRVLRASESKDTDRLVRELFYIDGKEPALPEQVPVLRVKNINDPLAVDFVRKLAPEIVCVNGTNLLREPMLDLAPSIRYGIINMHTGLSPYARGGNCNLHMLLEGHPEFVGVTIHHIDKGTDSGDIIISARPEMETGDNFMMIEARVFRLGINLMITAVRLLIEGRAERVKQWEPGKLFLRRTGYFYTPYLHVKVSRMIKNGLIRDYLTNRDAIDQNVRLVGKPS